MDWPIIIVAATLLVACANGANVSCGALFGIGIANRRAQSRVIRAIPLAWLLTLPMAALFSAGVYLLVRQL